MLCRLEARPPRPTLAHLVNTVQDLSARGVGLRVLTGHGTQIDTTTAAGRLVFGIFAALAEFERALIRERILAVLTAARARGRNGGRKFALSKAQVRLAQATHDEEDRVAEGEQHQGDQRRRGLSTIGCVPSPL